MPIQIIWSRQAEKTAEYLPKHILKGIRDWIALVEDHGVAFMQFRGAYKDEALQGQRFGQRSIRLNRSWRLIYRRHTNNTVQIWEILEITHHEY